MKFEKIIVGAISIGTALTLAACTGEPNEEQELERPPETETEVDPGIEETDPGLDSEPGTEDPEFETDPESETEPGTEDPEFGTDPESEPGTEESEFGTDPGSESEPGQEDPAFESGPEEDSEEPSSGLE
jgi:hypothetical protein